MTLEWYYLVAVPVWVLVHEGMHAVAALMLGWEVKAFKPWPHMTPSRWVWGRVRLKADPEEDAVHRTEDALISAAPYMLDFAVLVTLLLAFDQGYRGAAWVFGLCAYLDFVINWSSVLSSEPRENDAWDWIESTSLTRDVAIMHLIGWTVVWPGLFATVLSSGAP